MSGGQLRAVPYSRCSVGAWQGPAYSRHTLPGETEPVEQAQEILILQRRSLRLDASGSDGISPRKEVREWGCARSSSARTALRGDRGTAGITRTGKSALSSSFLL